jgi:hypothetical protein
MGNNTEYNIEPITLTHLEGDLPGFFGPKLDRKSCPRCYYAPQYDSFGLWLLFLDLGGIIVTSRLKNDCDSHAPRAVN